MARQETHDSGTVEAPVERETTAKLRARVLEATQALGEAPPVDVETSEEQTPAERLAAALECYVEKAVNGLGGHGGGGPAAGAVASTKKRLGPIGVVLAVLLGGGITGLITYVTLPERVESNAAAINEHEAKPMHDAAAKEFQEVKGQVQAVETKLGEVQTSQQEVVTGLKELKKESIDRLKEERDDLKRDLAREKRRNR